MQELLDRANYCLVGVPNETRQAFEDGTTSFERVLPGPDRMYPDTDSPPTPITEERLDRLRKRMYPIPQKREKIYMELGMSEERARQISISALAHIFDAVIQNNWMGDNLSLGFSTHLLMEHAKHLKRQGLSPYSVDDTALLEMLGSISEGKMTYEGAKARLEELAGQPPVQNKGTTENGTDCQSKVDANIQELLEHDKVQNMLGNGNKDHAHNLIMGEMMKTCLGIVPGRVLSQKIYTSFSS